MPKPELLETYLRKPITDVPDTTENYSNYAEANEKAVEKLLPIVGIVPEYIYQAQKYKNSDYAEGMRQALLQKEEIKAILNEYRTTP